MKPHICCMYMYLLGIAKPDLCTSLGIWAISGSMHGIYSLQSLIGSTCAHLHFAAFQHSLQMQEASKSEAGRSQADSMEEGILLAACGANEMLPQNPDLPADVFTSCLTTPIKV